MAIKKKAKVKSQKSEVVLLLTFFVLCVFPACAPKEENPPPADLINKKEMISVITDLSISEAALTGEPLATFNDTLRKVNVLKEHGITKKNFESSFKYYTENPTVLKEIYDSVLVRVESKSQARDSLKK